MTEKIGLQAVLETSDFDSGVKSYNSGIDMMESANEGFATSAEDVTSSLSDVDEAAATTGKSAVELAAQMEIVEKVYGQIKDTVGQAIELAELGSQANRAEERFRAFASQIGDADELLAAFQRGAGGTVDKLTAMTSAAKLLQMGLVSNNDEMEMVVEIATRLGDQTASAGDRVADFALLLANQSIPRLDNFGISSGKVRARIEELQKAFPGISREAAFSQAVFEEGAKSLDVLGERTADAGAKMEIARAKIADMRVEAGQRLLPIIGELFGFIASLESGTLALVAALSGGVGVLIKFSGGLGGLSEKMGASTLQMGALAAGIGLLVMEIDKFQKTMTEMNEAQDTAQVAAASLGDQVNELVAGGMSLGDAMAQVGGKVNAATEEFKNAKILGVIPLSNALNAGSEFTKTMTEAQNSLQAALIANTSTHAEYVAQVIAYNQGLTDGAAQLMIMSEAELNMARIRQEGASAASELADAILQERLALDSANVVLGQTAEETDRVTGSRQRASSSASGLAANMERLHPAHRLVADAAAAEAEKLADLEAKTQRVADSHARSEATAAAAAAALETKRQKDIETAQAEADLATKVMDASDAMIAQTFIQGLDPEAMGLTAYRRAVEDIQLAFGLATPESIKLAHGITQGIDAANAGQIAYGDLDQFINDLIADSETGANTFERYGVAIDDSSSASRELSGSSQALAAELNGLSGDAAIAAEGMDGATESTRELDAAMSETAGAAPGYGSAIGSGLRSGMEPEMDGFVASFRQKLQSLRDQLPSSEPKDSTSPLYGLGDSGEAIIDNLNQGIDAASSRSVVLMDEIGENMGSALASAISASTEDIVDDLFSAAGVLAGLGGAAASILQRRTLDPLEEMLAGREENLDEMVESMDDLVERQAEMRSLLDEMGPLDWIMLQYAKDRTEFSEEENALIEEFIANQHERARLSGLIAEAEEDVARWGAEVAEQQERILRLQEQQENLRFLQQQADLLALIAEKGLDVDEVLGGLQLGLDANIEDVIDAMTRAMQMIIEQAEDELGIASPSKVFEQIGAETMSGMAMGIERLMSLPVAQSAIATQAMIAAPAAIMAGGNTTIDNSRTMGDINITAPGNSMAERAQLGAFVRQIVREEVRGA